MNKLDAMAKMKIAASVFEDMIFQKEVRECQTPIEESMLI